MYFYLTFGINIAALHIFALLKHFTTMNIKNTIYYLFFAVIFLSSCSQKVYFTQQMKHQLTDNKINTKDIQFYNDRKITAKNK